MVIARGCQAGGNGDGNSSLKNPAPNCVCLIPDFAIVLGPDSLSADYADTWLIGVCSRGSGQRVFPAGKTPRLECGKLKEVSALLPQKGAGSSQLIRTRGARTGFTLAGAMV
jgi:hypothetical protein